MHKHLITVDILSKEIQSVVDLTTVQKQANFPSRNKENHLNPR
jgi:hypothetical protein